MRPDWGEERTGGSGLASARALPATGGARADSAPQTQAACVHTPKHTRAARVHHVHTQARTQTHTETDTCTHASTQGHTRVRTHPYTGTHPYTCPTCGQEGAQPTRPQTRAGTDTRSAETPPHLSTGFFQLVESAFPSPSWPTLLILQTSENQAPLDHDLLCFLRKELPANLGALELSVPRPPLSLAGEGFPGTQETIRSHLLDIREPAFPQFGGRTATGHTLDHAKRLRVQGDVPEPSVRRKWGLLLLVTELDRTERNRMTWRGSGDPGPGGQCAPRFAVAEGLACSEQSTIRLSVPEKVNLSADSQSSMGAQPACKDRKVVEGSPPGPCQQCLPLGLVCRGPG